MRRLLLPAALVVLGPAGAAAQCQAAGRSGTTSDFVAAPSTIFQTDFGRDALGEFPRGLELKRGAAQVAEWQGKRALKASQQTVVAVPLAATLPESFTVEVGVVNRNSKAVGAYTMQLYGGREFLSDFNTDATRVAYGTMLWEVSGGGASASGAFPSEGAEACMGQEVTVRLMVDGARLGFYADQSRLANVSNARFRRAAGIVITLEGRDAEANAVYLTKIRVAGGSQTVAQQNDASTSTTTASTVQPVDTARVTISSVAASSPTTSTTTTIQSRLDSSMLATRPDTRVVLELETTRSISTAQIIASGLFPPLTKTRSLTTTVITAAGLFPPLQTARTITTPPIVAKGQP